MILFQVFTAFRIVVPYGDFHGYISQFPVAVVGTPLCTNTAKAKDMLRSKGMCFLDVNAKADKKAKKYLVKVLQTKKYPAVFVNGEYIGDNKKLNAALSNCRPVNKECFCSGSDNSNSSKGWGNVNSAGGISDVHGCIQNQLVAQRCLYDNVFHSVNAYNTLASQIQAYNLPSVDPSFRTKDGEKDCPKNKEQGSVPAQQPYQYVNEQSVVQQPAATGTTGQTQCVEDGLNSYAAGNQPAYQNTAQVYQQQSVGGDQCQQGVNSGSNQVPQQNVGNNQCQQDVNQQSVGSNQVPQQSVGNDQCQQDVNQQSVGSNQVPQQSVGNNQCQQDVNPGSNLIAPQCQQAPGNNLVAPQECQQAPDNNLVAPQQDALQANQQNVDSNQVVPQCQQDAQYPIGGNQQNVEAAQNNEQVVCDQKAAIPQNPLNSDQQVNNYTQQNAVQDQSACKEEVAYYVTPGNEQQPVQNTVDPQQQQDTANCSQQQSTADPQQQSTADPQQQNTTDPQQQNTTDPQQQNTAGQQQQNATNCYPQQQNATNPQQQNTAGPQQNCPVHSNQAQPQQPTAAVPFMYPITVANPYDNNQTIIQYHSQPIPEYVLNVPSPYGNDDDNEDDISQEESESESEEAKLAKSIKQAEEAHTKMRENQLKTVYYLLTPNVQEGIKKQMESYSLAQHQINKYMTYLQPFIDYYQKCFNGQSEAPQIDDKNKQT